jgi:tetratricopeptide (TPR) repeat protein
MDDLHWADVPTLLLIEHMAELVPDMRVLGVGTYRDVELDVSRPLAATIERMVRGRTVDRLAIKRFDRAGVARMVEALAGRTPPDEIVGAIYAETEGNPFFVDEVFRHLVEEGKVFDANGAFRTDIEVDELDVPESVRLVVGRRLERLGNDAPRALAAGAVVGRGFPFSMLEEITDVDPGRLLDIVEEAEAARVIVPEDRDGEIHYSFAHELIRQTLLSSLSLLRRQRLHLAVADAMERRNKSAPSELAHHLLQAGAAADSDRTLTALERATDQAMESAAFEEALRAIDDALSIVGSENTVRRARLRERQGHAIRIHGQFEECLSIWNEVVDSYAELGEVDAAGNLCWQMGYLQVWLNRFDVAFATYTRALTLLGDRDAPAKPALFAATGLLTGFAGLYADGMAQLAEAEKLATESGDDLNLARMYWGRCIVEWSSAQIPPAVAAGMRGVEYARKTNDPALLSDALSWLAFPLGSMASFDEGAAVATEALEIALKAGHIAGEVTARRGVILNTTAQTGDLGAAERGCRKDLELCLRLKSPWSSQSYAWIAIVLTLRGQLDEALGLAEDALRLEPNSAWSGIAWTSRLMNRSYAGDVAELEAMIADKLDVFRAIADAPLMGQFDMLSVAVEASAVLGRRDFCAEFYPTVAAHAELVPIRPFDWALTARIAGMGAACAGDFDRATEHFENALRQAEKFPNVMDEPQVQHFYATMLLDRGVPDDHARARELLNTAVDSYRRIGIPDRARMAEELLARA